MATCPCAFCVVHRALQSVRFFDGGHVLKSGARVVVGTRAPVEQDAIGGASVGGVRMVMVVGFRVYTPLKGRL
jgi:hypothetical protein